MLKSPTQFALIGTSAKRLDTPSKVDGTTVYGIDTRLPGMQTSTLAIAPTKGGKLIGMDEAAARKVPGVRDVIRAGDEAVAVIGDHMWAAKQGLLALQPVWDAGPSGKLAVADVVAAMAKASESPRVIAKRQGDAKQAIPNAKTTLSAVYQLPFLSHSPMEPLNCTLHIGSDHAEAWVGTQVPVRAQKAVADATGLPLEKVVLHNQPMGGAFGRRLEVDGIIAAAIVKQVTYPVKLVWTREEDLQHDFYRPYCYDHVAAGLDTDGRLVGRTHRVTGSSIYARWAPGAFKGGLDLDAVDCGLIVNPDTVQAQIEGGLILGLGTAMYNEVTLANGAVQQSNFDDYRALRMNETPKIEAHLIRSGEDPGGIGEAGTAAAAPALGNAIFAATGRRVRNLPFGNAKLGQA